MCDLFYKANTHSHFTDGRKESQETWLILYHVAIKNIKIKIPRPLRHSLCSNPHHSYLLASVHICLPGKTYKFTTVYFKQERKHASKLASMFQHLPLINTDASLFLNLPSLRILLCKAPGLTECLLSECVWVTSLALEAYCRIPKQTVFWRKSLGVSPVLETKTRLNGTKRENGEGNNKRRRKSELHSLLFKETKRFKWMCLAACGACHKGGDDGRAVILPVG